MNKLCDMSYAELNDKLLNDFYNVFFFEKWKNCDSSNGFDLELIFSPKCNLKCEYCYINKNNENIYFQTPWNEEKTLHNVDVLLNWLYKNSYNPTLHIFSGELFAQESGWKLIEKILHFYETHNDKPVPDKIIIPTNATFLRNEELQKRMDKICSDFGEIGIDLLLSFSFDGLHADSITRKYKADIDIPLKQDIDQHYYDMLFAYMRDHGFLPHPMISPENVHVWKDNFLWFAEMHEKYNMPLNTLYLLEVRNANWTPTTIGYFREFLQFLMDYWWERVDHEPDRFISYMCDRNSRKGISGGNNILRNNFYTGGASCQSSCVISNQMMVRMSDLALFPCHRLLYPELQMAHFEKQEDGDLILKNDSIELNIGIHSFSPSSLPLCTTCMLNHMCVTPCYGSNYEITKDMFTPIPSVCQLEYVKVKTILEKLIEYDAYELFLDRTESPLALKIDQFVNSEIKEKKE